MAFITGVADLLGPASSKDLLPTYPVLQPVWVLQSDELAVYESQIRPLLEGAVGESENGDNIQLRARTQCEEMSNERKKYWIEQTQHVLRGDQQAADIRILYTSQQMEARELIAKLCGDEHWRAVALKQVKAVGFHGFRKMPTHRTTIRNVQLRFSSNHDSVYFSMHESVPRRHTIIDTGFHVTTDGSGLFKYHELRQKYGPLWKTRITHPPASWDETPISEKCFWAYQAVRFLSALVQGSEGACVYLRTDLMLDRLCEFRRVNAAYRPRLPEQFFPAPAAEVPWMDYAASDSDETAVSDIFSAGRSSEELDTSATTSPERVRSSAGQRRNSETPILDLLVGGDARSLGMNSLVQAVSSGILQRRNDHPGMRLAGRHSAMCINYGHRAKGVTSIKMRLMSNNTRPQLPRSAKVDGLDRELYCEWLLKPLVVWNRESFPELKGVRLFKGNEFGGTGRYESAFKRLDLQVPKSFLVAAKEDDAVNLIVRRLRSVVFKKDPMHVLLGKQEQHVHRKSPLATKIFYWSLVDESNGLSKQLRSCFQLGASTQDELQDLLEQKLYSFMVASPDLFNK